MSGRQSHRCTWRQRRHGNDPGSEDERRVCRHADARAGRSVTVVGELGQMLATTEKRSARDDEEHSAISVTGDSVIVQCHPTTLLRYILPVAALCRP